MKLSTVVTNMGFDSDIALQRYSKFEHQFFGRLLRFFVDSFSVCARALSRDPRFALCERKKLRLHFFFQKKTVGNN